MKDFIIGGIPDNVLQDGRINNIFAFVEADSDKQTELWLKYHYFVKWSESSSGYLITVGKYHGMPVTISVDFQKINDKIICFYSDASMVVHHDMIKAWIDQNIKCKIDNSVVKRLGFGFVIKALGGDLNRTYKIKELQNSLRVILGPDVYNGLMQAKVMLPRIHGTAVKKCFILDVDPRNVDLMAHVIVIRNMYSVFQKTGSYPRESWEDGDLSDTLEKTT